MQMHVTQKADLSSSLSHSLVAYGSAHIFSLGFISRATPATVVIAIETVLVAHSNASLPTYSHCCVFYFNMTVVTPYY